MKTSTYHVDMFLQALNAANVHGDGSMISTSELRDWCSLDKTVFDTVALQLAKNGVISLYEHDFPLGMSAEDRELLIRSSDGKRYYNGITIRTK
jgi:hypothetical protein